MCTPPPRSTLFPYTTLFRSVLTARLPRARGARDIRRERRVPGDRARARRLPGLRARPAPVRRGGLGRLRVRSEEHTSELQSRRDLVCRLLLEKKKIKTCNFY